MANLFQFTASLTKMSTAAVVGTPRPGTYSLAFNSNTGAATQDGIVGNAPRTFEWWALNDVASQAYFKAGIIGQTGRDFSFNYEGAGYFHFNGWGADWNRFIPNPVGVFTHYAIVYALGEMRFYLNNALQHTQAFGALDTAPGPITWGQTPYATSTCKFGGMRVWDKALTVEEIIDVAEISQPAGTAGVWGAWELEEGSGVVAADSSGNRRDLAILASASWIAN